MQMYSYIYIYSIQNINIIQTLTVILFIKDMFMLLQDEVNDQQCKIDE